MSDYGFATLDQNGNAAINAKNPIFGFDMGHRPMAFKTFRFRDVKTPPIHTGNVPTPNPTGEWWDYAQNMDTGEVTELIKKVKHGYNFRPVGYATITGTWKKTRRVQITQTQRAGTWGGNYTKTMIVDYGDTDTWDLIPNPFNMPWIANTGVDMPGSVVSLNPEDFSGTIWSYEYPKSVFCYMAPYGTDSWYWTQDDCPIWVEFDETYIYFYRKWSWSDTIRRCKFNSPYSGTTDDIQERVKVSASFAGSDFDVTVYLCPYPLKELL